MPDIIMGDDQGTNAVHDRVQNELVQVAQAQYIPVPIDQNLQTETVQVAQGAASIGSVASLTGQATIVRATGETVQAAVGTPVFQDDTFETASGSGVGLSFNDGSSFSLGSDARLTIDSFVYDGGGGDSNMVMNLAQGAFSFVSGQVAKSGDNNMTIVTPTATIGIRGTAGAGDDDEVVLLQEQGQQTGELTVTTQGGTVSLTTPNSYTNTSNPFAPPTSPITQQLGDIQSRFGAALRDLPVQLPANQNLRQGNNGNDQQGGEDTGEGEGEDTGEDVADAGDEGGDAGDGGEDGAAAEGEAPEGEGEVAEGDGAEGEDAVDSEGGDADVEGGADGDAVGDAGPGGDGAAGDGPGGEGTGGDGTGGDGTGGDGAGDAGSGGDAIGDAGGGDSGDDPGADGGPTGGTTQTASGDGGTGDGAGTGDGGQPSSNTSPSTSTTTVTATAPKTTAPPPPSSTTTTTTATTTVQPPKTTTTTQTTTTNTDTNNNPPPSDTPPPPESTAFVPGTFTLTTGADTVQFTKTPEVIKVTGLAQTNDSFTDAANLSQQFVMLETAGAQNFSINGVENVFFNYTLNSADINNITILGTTPVNFDAAGGSFNGNILGDAQSNTLTINDSSGIEQFVTVNFANTTGDTLTGSIDLQAGTDKVNFSGADLDVTINLSNVEQYTGSFGIDVINMQTLAGPGSIFDGSDVDGFDVLNLLGGVNTASIQNFETVNGVGGTLDDLTLETTTTSGTLFDLGNFGDGDILRLANGTVNDVFVQDLDTLFGGSGDDTIVMLSPSASFFDLGAGLDTLDASVAGNFNVSQLLNVENYLGAVGVDTVNLGSELIAGSNYDGGIGADALFLSAGSNNVASISNFEQIIGTALNETLTLQNNQLPSFLTTVDLGSGVDALQLASGGNDLDINSVETINTQFGDDIMRIFSGGASVTINDTDSGDSDQVISTDATSTFFTLSNIESFSGSSFADDVTLNTDLVFGSVYNGQGTADGDILRLAFASFNDATITSFETILGTSGGESLTLQNSIDAGNPAVIDLGAGFDQLILADSPNDVSVANVEDLTGGISDDTITVLTALTGGSFYDGGGAGDIDTLNLAIGINSASIVNFEFINGTAAISDDLTLEFEVQNDALFDLGTLGEGDILRLANGTFNLVRVQDLDTLFGGFGDDDVGVLSNSATFFDFGGGIDTLDATGAGSFLIGQLANLEIYQGSAGVDDVTMATDIIGGAFDGGAGFDTLTLFGNSSNIGIFANFEQIFGGAGNESLTFQAPIGGGTITIDLSAGSDNVQLADGGNVATFLNTEVIVGGIGDDQIFLNDTATVDIFLDLGQDEVVLNQNGGTYNFNTFDGVERLTGVDGGPFEIVFFNNNVSGLEIDLGLFGDGDQVNLAAFGTNSVKIFDLNNLFGGAGNDSVILGTSNAGQIVLGGGSDFVDASFVAGSTINSLTDVESFLGSGGTDFITLGSTLQVGSAYSGGGDGDGDVLQLFDGINDANIAHFEQILGGAANDILTLEGAIDVSFQTTIDLLGGFDTLNLFDANNSLIVRGVETLNGGIGDDFVVVDNDLNSGDTYFGNGGLDTLTLFGGGFNQASIFDFTNVFGEDFSFETLVVENNIATGTLFDLGDATDSDSLTLADGGNTVTIRDLQGFQGGIGNDIVTVDGNVLSGASYNGGGSSGDFDELILQDGSTVSAQIFDFEQISANTSLGIDLTIENGGGFFGDIIFTGIGIDSVSMLGIPNNIRVSGVENIFGAGGTGDTVEILTGGESINFAEVDNIIGSSGNDTITVIDSTPTNIELGLGDDVATGATGAVDFFIFSSLSDAVADGVGNGAETITNFEVGIDKLDIVAFGVGNFFYNGAGAFTGGGTASSRFVNGTETLEIDVNGDANADLEIVMNGITDTDLSSGDFAF